MPSRADVLEFTIAAEDFDASLLPESARDRRSRAFREAVKAWLQADLRALGGWREVHVDERRITVRWTPDRAAPDPLEQIVEKLRRGEAAGAVVLLQLLLADQPASVSILYNLGMALSDLGRLEEAEQHLRQTVALAPEHTNARVALGVALQRQGKASEAIEALMDAARRDPENPWAHRNLAACLAGGGQIEESIPHFRRAVELNPQDQSGWLGLARALDATGSADDADQAYRRVLEIDEYSPIAEAARQGLSTLAHRSFRERGSGGERPDAVMYCLGALERFAGMSNAEVQRVAFEIAVLGQRGIDVNDPAKRYHLESLPGSFSGLQLVCIMYAGFKRIAPDQDVGFDLSREYAAARRLQGAEAGD